MFWLKHWNTVMEVHGNTPWSSYKRSRDRCGCWGLFGNNNNNNNNLEPSSWLTAKPKRIIPVSNSIIQICEILVPWNNCWGPPGLWKLSGIWTFQLLNGFKRQGHAATEIVGVVFVSEYLAKCWCTKSVRNWFWQCFSAKTNGSLWK